MRRRPNAWLPLAALALVASASPVPAQEIRYTGRLRMPVVADAIDYPQCVTADLATGEVFVCDTRLNRILIFDQDGLYLHEIPGGEVFTSPRSLAVDPEGFLLVVATHLGRTTLLELDFDGLFRREIELDGLPDGVAVPEPSSVALSPAGDRIYALDESNLRLWLADRGGRVQGSVDLGTALTDNQRRDLILGHVDVYGETVLVPIASEGEIRYYDLDGRGERRTGIHGTAPCTIAFPIAAALSANGELLVADRQRMMIVRWDPRANRCLGDYYGLGEAPGYLYYPSDLALDRRGRLFVSQGFEGRVQMYEGAQPAATPAPR